MSEAKFAPDEGVCHRGERPRTRLRFAQAPSPTGGEGAARYGVIEIGEKSTNQLFGCTKPLIFGLMARGATSWAT
jgi:hypothetical protein